MHLILKCILLFFLSGYFLFAQGSNFKVGDKWIYENVSISGADTITTYLLKEIIKIYTKPEWQGLIFTVIDDSGNVHRVEELSAGWEFARAYGRTIWEKNKADFDSTYSDTRHFVQNKTIQIFDTTIAYQHWGYLHLDSDRFETKYSPWLGLFYLHQYEHRYDDENLNYNSIASLKAISLDGRIYGDKYLFNLWGQNKFPDHKSFQKGDKWVYKKIRYNVNGTINSITYLIKELIDSTGTLLVKEIPGDKQWKEIWNMAPDSSSIRLTADTFGRPGDLKLYDKYDKEYYDYSVPYSYFIYNKSGMFLNEILVYQHRCSETFGPKIPGSQTQTMYSPEIGLLFMRFYYSLNINDIFYNDWHYLKAARIGDKFYGNKILFDNVENAFANDRNFILEQNYPNPFNSITKLRYQILQDGYVTLRIFNSIGKQVVTLVNTVQPVGEYLINFDGSTLSSGVYFYQLQNGSSVQTKKLILLR